MFILKPLPATGLLRSFLRKEVIKPYGRGWDDPADDDLIRKIAASAGAAR